MTGSIPARLTVCCSMLEQNQHKVDICMLDPCWGVAPHPTWGPKAGSWTPPVKACVLLRAQLGSLQQHQLFLTGTLSKNTGNFKILAKALGLRVFAWGLSGLNGHKWAEFTFFTILFMGASASKAFPRHATDCRCQMLALL